MAGARSPASFIFRGNTGGGSVRSRWTAMRALVPSQMARCGEAGAAVAYVRLVAGVATHVSFKRAGVAEVRAALVTPVGLFSGVAAHVRLEVAWSTESGIALRALEGLFTGMNARVRLQVSRLTESHTAV